MPTSAVRRRVLVPNAAALALLLGAALSGCGGSDDSSATESPSASPSSSAAASPSSSGGTSEQPADGASDDAAAAGGSSEEGEQVPAAQADAEAPELPEGLKNRAKDRATFSQYVVDAWIHAFLTNDAKPLLDATKGGCGGCSGLRKEMKDRDEDGYFVELTGVGVGSTKEPKKQPPDDDVTITRTSLALPESRILNDDGSLRAISPAHPDTTFTAKVRWIPPGETKAKGKKNKKTPGELRLVSFGVETNDG